VVVRGGDVRPCGWCLVDDLGEPVNARDYTPPLDTLHADSLDARTSIRRQVNEARRRLGIPLRRYE